MNQQTRPETVQHAQSAQMQEPLEMEPSRHEETSKPVRTAEKDTILLPGVALTLADEVRNNSKNIVNLAEPLSFSTVDTNVAFMAKPTDKIGITYGKLSKQRIPQWLF